MLYYLMQYFGDAIPGSNVFNYITFRAGGAVMTAMIISFLIGPWMIDRLKMRQGKGQPIREDGPKRHIVEKQGTPTMGGLLILGSALISTLLWMDLSNIYVWAFYGLTHRQRGCLWATPGRLRWAAVLALFQWRHGMNWCWQSPAVCLLSRQFR